MTSKTIMLAKNDRKADKGIEVKDSYLDESNNLIINFIAELADSTNEQELHLKVNLDTVISLYRQKNYKNFIADTTIKKILLINSIYRNYNNGNSGIVVELKRSLLQKGFLTLSNAKNVKDSLRFPIVQKDFRYNNLYDNNQPPLNGKHLVFLYYSINHTKDKKLKYDFIGINVEPSNKKNNLRYWLLPVTIIGDIVTLPIQIIYLGVGYFIIEVLNDGKLP